MSPCRSEQDYAKLPKELQTQFEGKEFKEKETLFREVFANGKYSVSVLALLIDAVFDKGQKGYIWDLPRQISVALVFKIIYVKHSHTHTHTHLRYHRLMYVAHVLLMHSLIIRLGLLTMFCSRLE